MKTRLLSLSFAAASLLCGASAFAATVDVAIPFEFSAGGKMLPAGKYAITVDSTNVVTIRGQGPDTSMTLMATPDLTTSTKASATFSQDAGKTSLAKVNLAQGVSYILMAPKHTAVAAVAAPGEVLLSRH
jgi:hypothetical protein